MDIRFQTGGPSQWKANVMVVLACKGEKPAEICALCNEASPWFTIAPGLADFQGDSGEITLFHGLPALDIPRVLLVGLGQREKVTLDVVRRALGGALAHCRHIGLEGVLLPVPQLSRLPGGMMRLVEECVCGALLGLYRFTRMRTPKDDDRPDPRWLALGLEESSVPDDVHAAARRGEYAFEGLRLARNLANAPANVMTPIAMADCAQDIARRHQLHCEIFDAAALREMGCNTLLAVAQGSAQEARMLVLEHCPKGFEETKPLIFVGKGLTFDSGGISIKPATNMHLMKSDMSGAAAVLGALESIALQDIPCRVIAVIPCAENMPGGSAMRPGDVVTSYAGKTVEIINTDAEGRLVLCDAISYALKRWQPVALVDIATLTGACAVALGGEVAGLFCDDASLSERIISIGGMVGEPFWALPLWESYQEHLKSEVADICHMGPREGGAINAALFLKNFVTEGTVWAHLDIAGTDWAFKKSALSPVGALGFGTRTLVELARAYSK